jgi:splicing factor 3B subunit 1
MLQSPRTAAVCPEEMAVSLGCPPTENALSETTKRSCWDQVAIVPDAPMTQIIMNVLGIMHEDKYNHFLSDEELDAILPATCTMSLLLLHQAVCRWL